MPLINYIPSKDEDFQAWSQNFSTLITATPTAFGLVAGQAVAYAALVASFSAALSAATNPTTRTKPSVASKNVARATLEASSRNLAAVVQGYPSITDTQLAALGLTIRSNSRTPVPSPTTYPILAVVGAGPLQCTVRISDQLTPDLRAMPFGVIAAQIFVKYGTIAPVSIADATFLKVASRQPVRIDFDPSKANQPVSIVAVWQTRRGLIGPMSAVTSTTVIAPSA